MIWIGNILLLIITLVFFPRLVLYVFAVIVIWWIFGNINPMPINITSDFLIDGLKFNFHLQANYVPTF